MRAGLETGPGVIISLLRRSATSPSFCPMLLFPKLILWSFGVEGVGVCSALICAFSTDLCLNNCVPGHFIAPCTPEHYIASSRSLVWCESYRVAPRLGWLWA